MGEGSRHVTWACGLVGARGVIAAVLFREAEARGGAHDSGPGPWRGAVHEVKAGQVPSLHSSSQQPTHHSPVLPTNLKLVAPTTPHHNQ